MGGSISSIEEVAKRLFKNAREITNSFPDFDGNVDWDTLDPLYTELFLEHATILVIAEMKPDPIEYLMSYYGRSGHEAREKFTRIYKAGIGEQ